MSFNSSAAIVKKFLGAPATADIQDAFENVFGPIAKDEESFEYNFLSLIGTLDDMPTLMATFKNGSSTLEVDEVEYGGTPEYQGDTPTKASTASKVYTFSGWNPDITEDYEMTDHTTFTAQFSESTRKYTITFKDYDETTVLEEKEVAYGATPTYTGEAPTREGYTFTGWTPTLATVSADATYTAVYEQNAAQSDN